MQSLQKKQAFTYKHLTYILQGTVLNNLRPDHLAGPKALDPNDCNQFFDCTVLCLEVLTVNGNELRLFFGAKALLLYKSHTQLLFVCPHLKSAGGLFISTVVIFKDIVFNSASRYRSIKYSYKKNIFFTDLQISDFCNVAHEIVVQFNIKGL